MAVDTSDRTELAARGLEATGTAKSLLLAPDATRSVQWCQEQDAAAGAKSRTHWRNVTPSSGGALTDRFANAKGSQTIYLIRVAKGLSVMSNAEEDRAASNYAAIVDEPDTLVIAGYFSGYPSTKTIFENMIVRGRISKADGTVRLSVPK